MALSRLEIAERRISRLRTLTTRYGCSAADALAGLLALTKLSNDIKYEQSREDEGPIEGGPSEESFYIQLKDGGESGTAYLSEVARLYSVQIDLAHSSGEMDLGYAVPRVVVNISGHPIDVKSAQAAIGIIECAMNTERLRHNPPIMTEGQLLWFRNKTGDYFKERLAEIIRDQCGGARADGK